MKLLCPLFTSRSIATRASSSKLCNSCEHHSGYMPSTVDKALRAPPRCRARGFVAKRSISAQLVRQATRPPVKQDAECLFQPLQIGRHHLEHRIIMAPLTRCRAPNNLPTQPMATYYAQRATQGGLIISEGTVISEQARGYPNTPGIYTSEQVASWRPVTQAVKDKGGVFFCQLWHVGRASHPDFQPGGGAPVGPSAVPICDAFEVYTHNGGPFKYPAPRALELDEIPSIIQQFVDGAVNAIAAGFHGVELHAANGYILDQFLKDNSNLRTDEYGGSDVNKLRLILETTEAVAAAIGADRVGIRLCPYNTWMDATDTVERAMAKNIYLVQELQKRVPGMAYIHMVEPRVAGGNVNLEGPIDHTLDPFRAATSAPFIVAGGYQRDTAIAAVCSGHADAVVFGRYFVSTPDLVTRVAVDAPFNAYNRETFYSPGLEGYTDYPFLEDL